MLTIGDLAGHVGVKPSTLREWERRFGFPVPERLPSGHRRYPSNAVEEVRAVVGRQRAGLSLAAAIAAVRDASHDATAGASIFAALSDAPGREPMRLSRRAMLSISRAIEDACAASGGAGIIVGSFQREDVYRACEQRWTELARSADACIAFADFTNVSSSGKVLEVPIAPTSPLRREWAVAVASPRLVACLAGWEWPGDDAFEASWSIDPVVVRSVIERATAVARSIAPDRVPAHTPIVELAAGDLTAAMRLVDRIIEHLDR